VEHGVVWNCSGSSSALLHDYGVNTTATGVTASFFSLNFLGNRLLADHALLTMAGKVSMLECVFVQNEGVSSVPFGRFGEVGEFTLSNCVLDQPWPSAVYLTFIGGRSGAQDVVTTTFYGLNTRQCNAPAPPTDKNEFWQDFSAEEVIANIICAVALASAVLQLVFFFVKTLCKPEEGLDAVSDIEDLDDDGGSIDQSLTMDEDRRDSVP
jgi:hypothetical protein